MFSLVLFFSSGSGFDLALPFNKANMIILHRHIIAFKIGIKKIFLEMSQVDIDKRYLFEKP
jgi:hypothetical protein